MKKIPTTLALFLLLVLISISASSAPFIVHAIDISAIFIAFVLPSVITNKSDAKMAFYIWLVGGIVGILYWDVLASYVIVKKELFMGWYIIYPLGVSLIMLLQLTVNFISKPQNNAL